MNPWLLVCLAYLIPTAIAAREYRLRRRAAKAQAEAQKAMPMVTRAQWDQHWGPPSAEPNASAETEILQ
jgi:hypothetical protein